MIVGEFILGLVARNFVLPSFLPPSPIIPSFEISCSSLRDTVASMCADSESAGPCPEPTRPSHDQRGVAPPHCAFRVVSSLRQLGLLRLLVPPPHKVFSRSH